MLYRIRIQCLARSTTLYLGKGAEKEWHGEKRKPDIKKYSVSRYSMTNIDDFISECIAESMTKKSRATAKEVVNIIIGVD